MPEPNPVWGVHIVPGAVSAALVRRLEAGRYEILEAVIERAPENDADAVRRALPILTRRGVAGRGAVVALPDANGCLVTATVPPEAFELSDHEISNVLYEWTQFEPDQAELRHRCIPRDGHRDDRLVAALPSDDYRRFLQILAAGDASRLGVAFAGASTWRGALALGLVPAGGFLVAMQPRVTEVFAWPGGRARRHLFAIGEADLARDATAVDVLARDLAQLADYHRALRRDGEKRPPDPRVALAGVSACSDTVRRRLAAVLGPRLVDAPSADCVVAVAPKAKIPDAPLASLAGAVGAALEALRPADERIVLRHVPADLPQYRDPRPLAWFAAASFVAMIAGGAMVLHFTGARESTPPLVRTARAPAPPPATDASDADATKSPDAEPVHAPPPAPAASLDVETTGPGRVIVRRPAGAAHRKLRRRFLGRDGDGPEEPAVDVRDVDGSAGECLDEVPGPTGLYAWSVDGAGEARAFVEVRVEVDLIGPDEAGGARFLLRRPWRDGAATLAIDVAPGARVAGADAQLVFESGFRLDVVRTRSETERVAVEVPRFLPDGRIERGPDGAALVSDRIIERERRVFEADASAPDGSRRTWSRKMTDG